MKYIIQNYTKLVQIHFIRLYIIYKTNWPSQPPTVTISGHNLHRQRPTGQSIGPQNAGASHEYYSAALWRTPMRDTLNLLCTLYFEVSDSIK